MNWWTQYDGDPDDPREEKKRVLECANCYEPLNEYENEDPIIIDGLVFCDRCGSDLTHLRMGGTIGRVSDKTGELVRNVYYQWLHEEEYDKLGKIKHI